MPKSDDTHTNKEEDTGTPGGSEPAAPDRDEILSLLTDGIEEAHRKVTSGRVYDESKEQTRQGWIRVLAYAAGQYRQLVRDKELEQIEERLERLEEAKDGPK
ncbi:hypothetical protein [Haladaptatus salinisoli]|uniref:hypothetical protein n=1 Tax=Haladaptatus salinisoli TaxID=2884876 RepID=UPI001D0B71FD|nr:hypothetical protein [Haladaptatus salinisoli]